MADSTPPVQAAIHGPYEDLAIETIRLIEKIIDGQPPELKAKMWQDWYNFWNSKLSK